MCVIVSLNLWRMFHWFAINTYVMFTVYRYIICNFIYHKFCSVNRRVTSTLRKFNEFTHSPNISILYTQYPNAKEEVSVRRVGWRQFVVCRVLFHIIGFGIKNAGLPRTTQPNSFWFWEKYIDIYIHTDRGHFLGQKYTFFRGL